jgi:isopentenyl phosphate kinase
MATLIKLGGSVLTEHDRLFSFRETVASRLAEEIATYTRTGPAPIVVFGTGRAGKAYARHYTGPGKTTGDWDVYQQTTGAIARLGTQLGEVFHRAGVPHALLPANALLRRMNTGELAWYRNEPVRRMQQSGVVPLIGGDVLVEATDRFGIVSSDEIAALAATLSVVDECVFVTDVDGVLDDDGRLIEFVDEVTSLRAGASGSDAHDVTGGMTAKLDAALRIARTNRQVAIVNGLVPGRLRETLSGGHAPGTVVTAWPGVPPLLPQLHQRGSRCLHSDIA